MLACGLVDLIFLLICSGGMGHPHVRRTASTTVAVLAGGVCAWAIASKAGANGLGLAGSVTGGEAIYLFVLALTGARC